jgi:hypothetical protein
MFPLSGKSFPTTGDELTTAIQDALEDVLTFPKKGAAVKLTGDDFPAIKSLKIDLSAAPKPKGKRTPGITLAALDVAGHPILYEKSKADLELKAKSLTFDFAHDAKGNALLVLTDAKDGHVNVKISKDDLRAALLAAASAAAKSQGVTIQDLDVTLESDGPRALAAEVRVKAKKMIMSGEVTIRGRADISDDLVATLSNLSCTGQGMIGGMAAGFLQGKLKSYDGKKIPLMTFSLGDVTLQDLKVTTKPQIQLSATFGS